MRIHSRWITLGLAAGLLALIELGPAFGEQPARLTERTVVIPPGTSIPITLDRDIPVKQEEFDRTFPAHVTRDVTIEDRVAIPEGTPARVKLVPSSEKDGNVTLRLVQLRVGGKAESVKTGDARPDTQRSHHGLGEKTGIGAAAGAVVGAITGAGIVKGAVVGAGGGLAWGLLGGQKQIGRDTQVEFQTE